MEAAPPSSTFKYTPITDAVWQSKFATLNPSSWQSEKGRGRISNAFMGIGALFGGAATLYTHFYMKTVKHAQNASILFGLVSCIAGFCLKLKTKFPEDPIWLRAQGNAIETDCQNLTWNVACKKYTKSTLTSYFTTEELNALFFTKDAQDPEIDIGTFANRHGLPLELNEDNRKVLREKFDKLVESCLEEGNSKFSYDQGFESKPSTGEYPKRREVNLVLIAEKGLKVNRLSLVLKFFNYDLDMLKKAEIDFDDFYKRNEDIMPYLSSDNLNQIQLYLIKYILANERPPAFAGVSFGESITANDFNSTSYLKRTYPKVFESLLNSEMAPVGYLKDIWMIDIKKLIDNDYDFPRFAERNRLLETSARLPSQVINEFEEAMSTSLKNQLTVEPNDFLREISELKKKSYVSFEDLGKIFDKYKNSLPSYQSKDWD